MYNPIVYKIPLKIMPLFVDIVTLSVNPVNRREKIFDKNELLILNLIQYINNNSYWNVLLELADWHNVLRV